MKFKRCILDVKIKLIVSNKVFSINVYKLSEKTGNYLLKSVEKCKYFEL